MSSRNRYLALVLVTLFATFVFVSSAPSPAQAISNTIVISQVYGGGGNSGAYYKNDFVELYNLGTTAVDVSTWSVQYASSAGTTWQKTNLQGTIQPGHYYLVQEAAGSGGLVSLPTPDALPGSIPMSGSSGKVALVNNQTTLTGSGCPFGASIVDFVGFGSASCSEGASPTGTLANTTAARRGGDSGGICVDTDVNGADFTVAAPLPRNSSATVALQCGSTPPGGNGAANPSTVPQAGFTLLTMTPTSGAFPSNNTFTNVTCNISAIVPGSTSQPFYDDGTHGDAVANDGKFSFRAQVDPATSTGSKTISCTLTDSLPRTGYVPFSLIVAVPTSATIHDIQGAAHISSYKGQAVLTSGIVTARSLPAASSQGFWLEAPQSTWDADDNTSEGIFVFTNSAPNVNVGDSVRVVGLVSEYRPGGSGTTNLTITELTNPSITLVSAGNQLPPAVLAGTGGRVPPSVVIEDDATGDVETSGVFDPANDGIDFWESLEGMLVQVNNPVAVGPTAVFSGTNFETPIVADDGSASVRTPNGGLVVRGTPRDFNPERLILNNAVADTPSNANVGDHFTASGSSAITGVIDYNFGNFWFQTTSALTLVPGGLTRTIGTAASTDQVSIATFNVENLAPIDPDTKFSGLANQIITNLSSPDVIAIEEIQDNTGATNDGVVVANKTWDKLIAAIQAAGGPTYAYRQIDPVNNADGGATGGNIRVGFLFRSDRGLSFVDRAGATSTTANSVVSDTTGVHLQYSPGRIAPTDTAFTSSRKPLAGEFMYYGRRLFVIANHWNSKGGDQPLTGRYQPPTFSSETQRAQQATIVHDFVKSILDLDANGDIVVLGDLNDFQFSNALTTLVGSPAILNDLITTLPEDQRYTYVYEGNSEVLDHILVSNDVMSKRLSSYQPIHVNAEFADQLSDHDPQVAVTTLNFPPLLAVSSTAQTVQYSDPITAVTITDTDVPGDLPPTIVKSWQKSGDAGWTNGLPTGLQLSSADCVTICTWTLTGKMMVAPGIYTVRITATDKHNESTSVDITITVTQEDARATYAGTLYASTASATSTTANVTLAATVQDITAVDPVSDPNAGDIRNATLTFVNRDAGNATLCTAPAIVFVNSNDTTTGTGTCTWTANLGTADSLILDVGIVVGGYYTRNNSADDATLTIVKPTPGDSVSGGGYLTLTNSAGLQAGVVGSKTNFGFSVNYNKTGKNLQGAANVIVLSGGHVYQVKANSMTSLTLDGPAGTATFSGKASIQDITDPANPVSVDGNSTLQVALTDKGEPGSSDTIAITVWSKNGGLWFASNWSGTKTVEQVLGGGNLRVRASGRASYTADPNTLFLPFVPR